MDTSQPWSMVILLFFVCGILIASSIGSYFLTKGGWPSLFNIFPKGTVAEGQACQAHTECIGYGPGINDMACCAGTCTRKQADWAGVGWCPNECRSAPGAPFGTCGIYHWPRELNEPCNVHTDCQGYGPGVTDTACCANICTKKIADWAGVGYCPADCVGSPGGAKGTCSDSGGPHWPRLLGEQCASHTDCKGWGPGATDNACCSGICTQKKKDWAGIGYCPADCVGKIGGKPGTC